MRIALRSLCLGLCATAISSVAYARLIGGTEVTAQNPIAQHAVRLSIVSDQWSSSTCTGTLIESDIVLTSAHCLHGVKIKHIDVVFQDLAAGTSTTVRSTSFVKHESYAKGSNKDDIALVKISKTYPSVFFPVKYTFTFTDLLELELGLTSTFFIAGYGRHQATQSSDLKLREGRMTGEKVSDKILVLKPIVPFSTLCFGDSGGPTYLVHDGVVTLIGINTYTFEGCASGAGTTLVFSYADWIEDNITKL